MATAEPPPGIVLSTPEDENIEAAIQRLKAIVSDILHEAEETPIEQCYADIERITQLVREDSPFLDGPDAVQQQAPPTQHRPSVSSRAVLLIQRTARAGKVRQRLGLQRVASARASSPASSVARSPSRGAASGDSTAVAASYMMQQAATIERLRTELAALQKHCGRSTERSASPPMAAAPRRSGSGSSPSSSPADLRGDVVFTRSTSQPSSSPPQPGAGVGSIGSAFHDVQLARHPLTAQHTRSRSPLEEMLFPRRVPPPRIGAALAGCARSSSKEKRAAASPRPLQRKTSAALMTEKASAAFAEERRFHARHRSPPMPERRTRSPPPASPPSRPAAHPQHQSPAKAPALHQSPATSPSKAPAKGYTYSTISSTSVHGGVSSGGGAGGGGGGGVGHTSMPRMSLSPTVTRRFNAGGLNSSGSSSSYAGRKSPAAPRLQTSVSVRGQPSHSSGGAVPPSPKYPK